MPGDPNNPTPMPAGTEDLESRIGTGSPGAALASQQPDPGQQPYVQDQSGATLAMGGSGTPEVGQPPITGTKDGIKSLLTGIFGQHGMGGYLMNSFGLPTPDQRQQKQVLQAQKQQMDQSQIQMHQATANALNQQNQSIDYPISFNEDGTPKETIQILAKGLPTLAAKQMQLRQQSQLAEFNQALAGAKSGYQVSLDPVTGKHVATPIPQAQLSPLQQATIAQKQQEKTPSEIRLRMLSDQGDPQATRILAKMQADKVAQATERGMGFAKGRALYTPFETVQPGTNIPTTISNMQALQSGAPKVSMGAQTKLGGNYALFNDAYGILDKVDALADKVHLDDPGVSSRVAAGYAAIKDPAAKGMTGEILSNVFAHQPVYNTLTPDERDLVLTMAQGKAAGTGLRGIMGQAGTNEMQQRLDSALFPGGQTAASTAGLKSQTEATRQLLDRFIVGQVQAGLNAPGSKTALQTKRAGAAEPSRPAGVPPGYKFNANGPKGAGWYKP